MAKQLTTYRGCLLGMAAGDALGHTVNDWGLDEIRLSYGPEGIQGYDCLNGYAVVTAHTQVAAYAANGLLLGLTRGQMRGEMAPYVRYVYVAEMEWARQRTHPQNPQKPYFCWVGEDEVMRDRRSRDTLMVDTLLHGRIGTMEEPKNKRDGAAALTAAAMVGVFCDASHLNRKELVRLGAETVALTHGNAGAFLAGAALSYLLSRIVADGETNLRELAKETMTVLREQFSRPYASAVGEVCQAIQMALSLSISPNMSETESMEQLRCDNAVKVLSGALYSCMIHPSSFDAAVVCAVNHSGESAITGAVAGAISGAMLGDGVLKDFFLKDLEPLPCLEALAADLFRGCPMERGSGLFDFAWDEKYVSYRR